LERRGERVASAVDLASPLRFVARIRQIIRRPEFYGRPS